MNKELPHKKIVLGSILGGAKHFFLVFFGGNNLRFWFVGTWGALDLNNGKEFQYKQIVKNCLLIELYQNIYVGCAYLVGGA